MTTSLIDLNNLAVRHYCSKEVGYDTDEPNISLWKHNVIDSIYQSLYKEPSLNEIVLAVDDRKSWRKLYWARYKESRKGKRDKSKINWNIFHTEYRKFCDEIQDNLPFKVLLVENAEADDIIGVLALKDNREYIVISNDEDYLQLVSDRVKLYNPQKMMFMDCPDTEKFIVMKCLTGQAKDDIFNIKTPLDWPAGKRKPGFGEVSANAVLSSGYKDWLIKNNLEKRFDVNRILIDFHRIPTTIKSRIINAYKNYILAPPDRMYGFFAGNKFGGFIEDFSRVESKLLQLYN